MLFVVCCCLSLLSKRLFSCFVISCFKISGQSTVAWSLIAQLGNSVSLFICSFAVELVCCFVVVVVIVVVVVVVVCFCSPKMFAR